MAIPRAFVIVGVALLVGGAAVLLLRGEREEVPRAEVPDGGGKTPKAPAPGGPLASDAPPPKEPQRGGAAPASPPVDPDLLLAKRVKSIDNVRVMGMYFLAGGAGLEKPWPKYSGHAFVLWLVASNKIDRRDPKQLSVLFSPADDARSLEKAGGVEAYAKLTLEALKTADPGRGPLTSYAGRRNAEREYVLGAEEQARGAAILADLSFPDGAIVGFAGGSAKWLTREELGLGPDDPIVAGDASKSPILQKLSSD